MNEVFSTRRKQVTNRLYIAVFFKENLYSACHFASICAAMCLLKFFQVQGKHFRLKVFLL